MMSRILADHRWHRLGRAAALLVPAFFAVVWAGFWGVSHDPWYAAGAAVALTVVAAAGVTLTAAGAWGERLTPRWRINLVVVVWSLLPALLVALILAARGWPVVAVIGCGVVTGALAGLSYRRVRGRMAALQPVFVLSVDTISDAELLRAATDEPVDDPRVPSGQKAIQRLNHARALTFLALRNGDFDRLVDALPLLRAVVLDPDLDPAVNLLAARDLMDAHNLLVQYGGDGAGYRDAIALFAQLVRENPGIEGAQAVLHEYQAGYQQYLVTQATDQAVAAQKAGDQAATTRALDRMRTAWTATEQELVQALQLASEHEELTAQYLTELGVLVSSAWTCLGEDRSDEGVELCRQALSLRAGRSRAQRPRNELMLAGALTDRYDQRGRERDADEAEGLLNRLVQQGNPVEARAREMLLRIALLRGKWRP